MTFKKVSIQDFDMQPFKNIGKDWLLISAQKDGVVNTMTASWGGVGVLWNKNVATIYIRPQRYTKEFVDNSDYFTLTFFDKYKPELGILGKKSGRDGDKIKEVGFSVTDVENQPTFTQGKMVMVCKKIYADTIKPECFMDEKIDSLMYPERDHHTMYIGEVISIYINETE